MTRISHLFAHWCRTKMSCSWTIVSYHVTGVLYLFEFITYIKYIVLVICFDCWLFCDSCVASARYGFTSISYPWSPRHYSCTFSVSFARFSYARDTNSLLLLMCFCISVVPISVHCCSVCFHGSDILWQCLDCLNIALMAGLLYMKC